MTITLQLPDAVKLPPRELRAYQQFLQKCLNRKVVGFLRYGDIKTTQRYAARMRRELDVYDKQGNAEQLRNIAVYAFLESFAPSNKKFHDDAFADSVTRKKFGGVKLE